MEKYTDEMLKKYLTWVKTLDENDINLDHYLDFLNCSAYNKLIKPFGSDSNDVSEFVYALIYENLGPPFSKEFVRPQLNSYTIEHRNNVNIRRVNTGKEISKHIYQKVQLMMIIYMILRVMVIITGGMVK